MMEKESKITNEDLARMIKDNVVDKMANKEDLNTFKDEVDGRFDGLEKKIDGIDKNVKEINMKLHDMEESVHGDHRRRIEKLEEAVF